MSKSARSCLTGPSRLSDWLSSSRKVGRSAFRRAVTRAAMWRPGLSYVVASLVDQTRKGAWRLQGIEPALGAPFWGRPTAFRDRLLVAAVENPTRRWSYPHVVGGPDPKRLCGPIVFVTFHLGANRAHGAVFARLPGPKLALTNTMERSGTVVNIGRIGFVFAAKSALDTLRAGGFVFTHADGMGCSSIEAELFGRRIVLPRGTFTIARLAGAPLLPVAARWRGPAIEMVSGDRIAPGDESEMAAALARWVEAYLVEHPEEVHDHLLDLLRAAPLADRPVAQGALQCPVPDFPGLRPLNSSRLHDHDPIGSETERVKDRP